MREIIADQVLVENPIEETSPLAGGLSIAERQFTSKLLEASAEAFHGGSASDQSLV
jgi:hypothetical protein